MSDDPYATPRTTEPVPAKAPAGPVKAVLTGLAVDICGSTGVGIIFTLVYGVILIRSGVSREDFGAALADMPPTSMPYIISNVLGCCCSALGGYVCTRMARRTDYKLAKIVGGLSATIGVSLSLSSPLPRIFIMAMLTFASVLAGAKMAIGRRKSAGDVHTEVM